MQEEFVLKIPNSVTIEDEKGCSYIQEVQYEFGSVIAAAAGI